jgi:hypothetical protein
MKNIKIIILAFVAISLTSCLKSVNDIAGLRTDPGQVVTAILEKQYQVNDGYNLGQGYVARAGFSFASPATENVRFFTLHISQPGTKISGNLAVKITMTASSSGTLPPTGAVTIPAEISIPASSAEGFDFPVRFAVNKSLLNPAVTYAATFTISSVSQGVYSDLEKSVDITLVNSKYSARYNLVSTVKDPAGQYGVSNNTKPMALLESTGNSIILEDLISGSGGLQAANLQTGAATNIITPRFVLDASGKVTAIFNGATNLNATIDPSSQFVYTDSENRSFTVAYTFSFTSTVNGASNTRIISVTEKYTLATLQAYL